MIALDHIALWTRNHYRHAYELSQESGLGSFDGGFFPVHGLAQKIVPLGGDVYIEVEGIVDLDVFIGGSWIRETLERNTVDGACFMGWCLRSDSFGDLEALATYRGVEVQQGISGGYQVMTTPPATGMLLLTPPVRQSWGLGKPNMYYEPDLSAHYGRQSALPGTGPVVGHGVSWIEIGGTREELADWLGPVFAETEAAIDIRYNGGRSGLHAVGVNTSAGEKVIRRQPPREV